MSTQVSDLARRLAERAEVVCRHYLSNGRRSGNYWLVGDVNNTPGRSLFVRLTGRPSGRGVAGKWTDSATGQHGDLLDVIRLSRGLAFSDATKEARRFLSLPPPAPDPTSSVRRRSASVGSPEAARRLWAISQGIAGTLAQSYLVDRGITHIEGLNSLRFHPRCYYRPSDQDPTETWPALIAAVTDLGDRITGVHRTWLNPHGFKSVTLGKAPIDTPRRAMGDLLGHAVRFGIVDDVAAAGEGIETMLSLRMVLPTMPMLAALSAAHLAAILFPSTLRRLYVARDDDSAGDAAHDTLRARAHEAGIDVIPLSPGLGDFNDDLRLLGIDTVRTAVRIQLLPQDVTRFMLVAELSGKANEAREVMPRLSIRKGPRRRPS